MGQKHIWLTGSMDVVDVNRSELLWKIKMTKFVMSNQFEQEKQDIH